MKKLLYCTVLLFSIIYYANAQSVVVNSDGSHSIGVNHGSTTVVIHPDGTHSIGFNQSSEKKDISKNFSHSCSSTSESFLYQDNHLFSEDSNKANQIYDLYKRLIQEDISKVIFSDRKTEIINSNYR